MSKFFFGLILFFYQVVFSAQFKVLQAILDPVIFLSNSEKINLKKNLEFQKSFKLLTNKNQFAQFKLADDLELSVYENSEIKVDLNDLSELKANDQKHLVLHLISGQIYIHRTPIDQGETKAVNSELEMDSDFFKWPVAQNKNINLLINLDNTKALIYFCNREQPFEISLFDHEQKMTLLAAESIQFQGQIIDQKLAYDILLNGRKIPKGLWQQKQKCSFEDIKQLEKNMHQVETIEKIKSQKLIQKSIDQKKSDEAKFLCHKPYGQLSDCAWILSGEKCSRTHCDAEGNWSDLQSIAIDKAPSCTKKYFVSKCDY